MIFVKLFFRLHVPFPGFDDFFVGTETCHGGISELIRLLCLPVEFSRFIPVTKTMIIYYL